MPSSDRAKLPPFVLESIMSLYESTPQICGTHLLMVCPRMRSRPPDVPNTTS